MQTDGTLNHFRQIVSLNWSKLSPRCKKILEDNADKLKINYELVRLNFDCEYSLEIAQYIPEPKPLNTMNEQEFNAEVDKCFK